MATNPDRASHFPAIERKYGQPMAYWHSVMAELAGQKYPEQVAYLRENHGFSQAHANALVMYSRGSKSSRRFNSADAYLAQFPDVRAETVRAIFAAIQRKHKGLELVVAWNQPMLRCEAGYVFGATILQKHGLLAPWSTDVLAAFAPRLAGYKVKQKTFEVPADWQVDAKLLQDLVGARLAELA